METATSNAAFILCGALSGVLNLQNFDTNVVQPLMRSGLSSPKSRVFAYLKPINLSRAWYSKDALRTLAVSLDGMSVP